uniref:K Homology domain-containing protein n=1 Tax=Scylla olivacea TaxID=85551 RepID=A0A0P4VRJ4_SCYOL
MSPAVTAIEENINVMPEEAQERTPGCGCLRGIRSLLRAIKRRWRRRARPTEKKARKIAEVEEQTEEDRVAPTDGVILGEGVTEDDGKGKEMEKVNSEEHEEEERQKEGDDDDQLVLEDGGAEEEQVQAEARTEGDPFPELTCVLGEDVDLEEATTGKLEVEALTATEEGPSSGVMYVPGETIVEEALAEGWTVAGRRKRRKKKKERCREDEAKASMAEACRGPEEGYPPGVRCVLLEKEDQNEDGAQAWTKKRRRKKARKSGDDAKASTAEGSIPQQLKAAPPARKRPTRPAWDARDSVRRSWQEDTVEVSLPVAPHLRRHVIGPRGATVRKVEQEWPGVRVAVPSQQDARTGTVTVRGPRRQVEGAAARLKAVLQEEEKVRVSVAVMPQQRHLVVGPGGATIRRLQQEFPEVIFKVPPVRDRKSATILLVGPRRQLTAAEASVTACLAPARRPARP